MQSNKLFSGTGLRIITLLIIAISFSAVRCKKSCIPLVFDLEPKVLQYFGSYKTGNSWVFRNTGGAVDSLVVANSSDTFFRNTSGQYDFECKPRERDLEYYANFTNNSVGTVWTKIRAGEDSTLIVLFGDIRALLIYTPASGLFSLSGQDRKTVPVLDSLRVGSNTFRQVLAVPVTDRNTESGTLWFAPEIGIVQYAFKQDTIRLESWRIK